MNKRETLERASTLIRSGVKTEDWELIEDGLQLLEKIFMPAWAKRITIAIANAADQLRY